MNINSVLGKFGIALLEKPFDVVLPVGISFYIFQALSYTVDIFQGGGYFGREEFVEICIVCIFLSSISGGTYRTLRKPAESN